MLEKLPKSFCARSFAFLAVMLGLLLTPVLLRAQSNEEQGDAAQAAGHPRDALTYYMAAWKDAVPGSPSGEALRKKIISVAHGLQPPPEIPAEARQAAAEAAAKAKLATAPSDFAEAAKSFGTASRLAPWNADYYYNMGSMQKAGGQLQDAIGSLNLYLAVAPDAPDAHDVQDVIIQLEAMVKTEEAHKQLIRLMNDTWVSANPIAVNSHEDPHDTFKAQVSVSSAGEADIRLSLDRYGSFQFKGALEGRTVNARLVGPDLQPEDSGRITLAKAGGLLRATVQFTWRNTTFSYDDFLNNK